AHQLVKMDLGSGNESADAAAPLYNPFALEKGEGMASGHQADLMDSRKVAFGGDAIAGAQLTCFDPFADGTLNPLVGRNGSPAVSILLCHTTLPDVAESLQHTLHQALYPL